MTVLTQVLKAQYLLGVDPERIRRRYEAGTRRGDVKLAAVIAGRAGYTSPTAAATALVGGFVTTGVVAAIALVVGAAGEAARWRWDPGCSRGAAATLAAYG